MMGPVAAEYALVSWHLKAAVWTKTETSYGELLVSRAKNRGIVPGQLWRRMGDSNSRGVAPNTLSNNAGQRSPQSATIRDLPEHDRGGRW
jgi:hypothetical protein